MSKKIAAGAQGIVLDVKAGIGAFMRTVEDASALAQMMVNIGADAGRDVIALISDMNQPLGRAVGNAVEVVEAVETLKGGGMLDFHEHCVTIAGTMLKLAGRGTTYTEPDAVRTLLESKLRDGSAYDKFRAMVEAQGGAVTMLDDTRGLPQARMIVPYGATHSGYVAAAAADEIAWGAFELGAGRETKEDSIDHAVGLEVHVKVGDTVQAGQTIATIHANDAQRLQACMARLDKAFAYSADPVERLPLFYEVFSSV
jgi:pyrimidine-nucleoside phosphorylase